MLNKYILIELLTKPQRILSTRKRATVAVKSIPQLNNWIGPIRAIASTFIFLLPSFWIREIREWNEKSLPISVKAICGKTSCCYQSWTYPWQAFMTVKNALLCDQHHHTIAYSSDRSTRRGERKWTYLNQKWVVVTSDGVVVEFEKARCEQKLKSVCRE